MRTKEIERYEKLQNIRLQLDSLKEKGEVTDEEYSQIGELLHQKIDENSPRTQMRKAAEDGHSDAYNLGMGHLRSTATAPLRNILSYGASAAKLVGAKETAKDLDYKRQMLEGMGNPVSNFVSEVVTDPINMAPAGLLTKGSKAERVIGSALGGGAIGAGSTYAKDYGNTEISDKDKELNAMLGGGLNAGVNALIAGLTRGAVKDASELLPQDRRKLDETITDLVGGQPQAETIPAPMGDMRDSGIMLSALSPEKQAKIKKVIETGVPATRAPQTPQEALQVLKGQPIPDEEVNTLAEQLRGYQKEGSLFPDIPPSSPPIEPVAVQVPESISKGQQTLSFKAAEKKRKTPLPKQPSPIADDAKGEVLTHQDVVAAEAKAIETPVEDVSKVARQIAKTEAPKVEASKAEAPLPDDIEKQLMDAALPDEEVDRLLAESEVLNPKVQKATNTVKEMMRMYPDEDPIKLYMALSDRYDPDTIKAAFKGAGIDLEGVGKKSVREGGVLENPPKELPYISIKEKFAPKRVREGEAVVRGDVLFFRQGGKLYDSTMPLKELPDGFADSKLWAKAQKVIEDNINYHPQYEHLQKMSARLEQVKEMLKDESLPAATRESLEDTKARLIKDMKEAQGNTPLTRMHAQEGGALYGIEQDEDGNWTIDPQKALIGMIGGMVGQKIMAKISASKNYEEKLSHLRAALKSIDKNKLTSDEKAVYEFAMSNKSGVNFLRDGLSTMLTRGNDNKGFKHFIIRHYGDGADSEISHWDVLRIGKTIKEGTPLTEAELEKNYERLGKPREAYRRTTPDGKYIYIVGVGKERGNQEVITYYKVKLGEEGDYSKAQGGIQDEPASGNGDSRVSKPESVISTQNENLNANASSPETISQKAEKNLKAYTEGNHPLTKEPNGTDKVFYHGTKGDFNTFEERNAVFGKGVYVAEETRLANMYSGDGHAAGGNVMPLYISLKNPLVLQKMGRIENAIPIGEARRIFGREWESHFNRALPDENPISYSTLIEKLEEVMAPETIAQRLRLAGYDGLHYSYGEKGNAILLLDKNQAKSARGNRGTFDPTDPNILHSSTEVGGGILGAGYGATQDEENPLRGAALGAMAGAAGGYGLRKLATGASDIKEISKLVGEDAKKSWGDATNQMRRLFTDTLSKEYHDVRDAANVHLIKAGHELEQMHHKIVQLPEDIRTEMHNYLSGDSNGANLDPRLRDFVDKVRSDINALGERLVVDGTLTREAFEEWRDYYLHRNYERHFFKEVRGIFGKKFDINKIHERGFKQKFNTPDEAMDYLEEIGAVERGQTYIYNSHEDVLEILKERGLLDRKLRDGGLRAREVGGKLEIRRDWTMAEREEMGEIRDAAISFPETLYRLQRMAEHAEFLKQAKSINGVVAPDNLVRALSEEELISAGYRKMGKDVKWGALSDQWVRVDVHDDIKATADEIYNTFFGHDSALAQLWLSYLRLWKKSKTVWNAPSHINNLTSNIFLQHLAGMSAGDILGGLGRAAKIMREGRRYDELSRRSLTNLSDAERAELAELGDGVRYFLEARNIGLFGRSQLQDVLRGNYEQARTSTLGKADKWASDWYVYEDNVNKLAMYTTLRERHGMSAEEAREAVLKIIPDYTKPLPLGWRIMRDTGLSPFISWTYYTLPNIIKLLVTKRGAMQAGKVLGVLGAMEYFMTGMEVNPLNNLPFVDGDKPEDWQGRRMAVMKDGSKVTTVKMDRWIPYLEYLEPWNFARSTVMSGIPQKAIFMAGGSEPIDPYSARPIMPYKDTGKNVRAGASYAAQNFLPVPQQIYSGMNIIDSLTREPKKRVAHPEIVPKTAGQGLLQFLGLNTATYDVNKLREVKKKKEEKKL